MRTNPNAGFKKKIIGGNELTIEQYTAYLNMLRAKPFLTANEAGDLFNIGLSRVQEMMNEPDWIIVNNMDTKARKLSKRKRFFKLNRS